MAHSISGPVLNRLLKKPDYLARFSNGYKKMAAKNNPILGWPVPGLKSTTGKPDLFGSQMFAVTKIQALGISELFLTRFQKILATWVG
jgi:hypothetical protein